MQTLLEDAISQLETQKIFVEFYQQLSSGKEAVVYLVSMKKELLALKVYKDYLKRSFKKNQEYIAGKYIQKPSQRKAIEKKNRYGKDLMHSLWVKREFYLLKNLYDSGINIPEPIVMTNNAILMEYIGDESGSAPLLKDVNMTKMQKTVVHKKILEDINKMYEMGIVHGDLSAFNILYWNEKPYIIDFPQSLDIRTNPNAEDILKRDRENIEKWYRGV